MTVYFVRSDCGRIKIGYTADRDPSARLATLQTASPRALELVATISGAQQSLERFLHRSFREECVHGEWFSPSERLLKTVAHVARFKSLEGLGQMITDVRFPVHELTPNEEAFDHSVNIADHCPGWDWIYMRWADATHGHPELRIKRLESMPFRRESGRARDGHIDERRGTQETALLLHRFIDDPEKRAAVWILAGIRQLSKSEKAPLLSEVVPALYQLAETCRDTLGFSPAWHYRSFDVLPEPMDCYHGDRLSWSSLIERIAFARLWILSRHQVVITEKAMELAL